jgi:hypothetical protein
MNMRLMLLVAVVLAALAFAALPTVAAGGEYTLGCETSPCVGSIQTTTTIPLQLENDAGEVIVAGSATGTVSFPSVASTGTVQLLFHEVKEKISGFTFTCNSSGLPNGTVTTNKMTAHLINLEPGETAPGVLITGANVTFNCAGELIQKTVTGAIVGSIEVPTCGGYVFNHTVAFEKSGTGTQKYMQVTTTGTAFDLISGTHAADTTTTSLTGTAHVLWKQETKITC